MTDIFSAKKRSMVMQAIRSSGNRSTELRLIELFKKHSIKGWRRKSKVAGSPDFVFSKQKVAVFADGCFWHGHDCRKTVPQTNKEFWQNKISRNKKRDRLANKTLRADGWRVVRFWECELGADDVKPKLRTLAKALKRT